MVSVDHMITVSSATSWLMDPLAWISILLLIGVLTNKKYSRIASSCFVAALVTLAFSGWLGAAYWVLHTWESRYPRPAEAVDNFHGFIALGGIDNYEEPTVLRNPGAERLFVPLRLIHENPRMTLLFSGGKIPGRLNDEPEADKVKAYLEQRGLLTENILFERASRNTLEHARLCASVPGVQKSQRWLLVTSAAHMPRAMDVFVAHGWNVTAFPVHFRAEDAQSALRYDLDEGRRMWRMLAHELIGIYAYRLFGAIGEGHKET
jgi:uncharacterized SAM-binding protein YcdF (DUF218 family)